MDWLSEIEIDFEDENYPTRGDGQRMARVLREFVMGVKQAKVCFELLRDARQIKDATFDEWFRNMSDDAKELCVAANDET